MIINLLEYKAARKAKSEARRKQRLKFNLHEIPVLKSFKQPIRWVVPSEPHHGAIEPVSTHPLPIIRINYTKDANDPEH